MIFLILLSILIGPQDAILPNTAKSALDLQFKDWRILSPRPKDRYSQNPSYSFNRCYFNKDDKYDFGLVVETGRDSTLTEHFVALVSDGESYKLYVVKSFKVSDINYGQYELFINREHTYVAVFGFEIKDVPAYLHEYEKKVGGYFDVDCFSINPKIGNNCYSYIYHDKMFYQFYSCD